jgi:hypothetical protein
MNKWMREWINNWLIDWLIHSLYNTLVGGYNEILIIVIDDEITCSNEIFRDPWCILFWGRSIGLRAEENYTCIKNVRNLWQSRNIYGFWTVWTRTILENHGLIAWLVRSWNRIYILRYEARASCSLLVQCYSNTFMSAYVTTISWPKSINHFLTHFDFKCIFVIMSIHFSDYPLHIWFYSCLIM